VALGTSVPGRKNKQKQNLRDSFVWWWANSRHTHTNRALFFFLIWIFWIFHSRIIKWILTFMKNNFFLFNRWDGRFFEVDDNSYIRIDASK
jgi:hypothetical protein